MYEKILVPLDGSDLAEMTFPFIERAIVRMGSEIILFHVDKSQDDKYRSMHEAYLEKVVGEIKSGAINYLGQDAAEKIKVTAITAIGDPAEEIVDYAEKNNMSAILMATHGRSGLTRWMLGSVAERVIRATSKPVTLLRANASRPEGAEKDLRSESRALVCVDGSKESEAILPYIKEVALQTNNSEIILFEVLATGRYVVTPGGYDHISYLENQMQEDRGAAENYLEKLADGLRQKGLKVRTEVRFGNAAEEIIGLADELKVEVVAMSTHGRSGFTRWALGSVADRVLRRGNTPLVLARPTKK